MLEGEGEWEALVRVRGTRRLAIERRTPQLAGLRAPFAVALVTAVIVLLPTTPQVWEGHNAILGGRKLMGTTNPADSAPGSIRGDYAVVTGACAHVGGRGGGGEGRGRGRHTCGRRAREAEREATCLFVDAHANRHSVSLHPFHLCPHHLPRRPQHHPRLGRPRGGAEGGSLGLGSVAAPDARVPTHAPSTCTLRLGALSLPTPLFPMFSPRAPQITQWFTEAEVAPWASIGAPWIYE